MARRKVAAAARVLAAFGADGGEQWQLARLLCALRHWADAQGASYAGADATASRHYFADLETADQTRLGGSNYDGWERIHDDNKAEGRPVGGQWSKAGVRYVGGLKRYGRK